jgi:hypothetical protein
MTVQLRLLDEKGNPPREPIGSTLPEEMRREVRERLATLLVAEVKAARAARPRSPSDES